MAMDEVEEALNEVEEALDEVEEAKNDFGDTFPLVLDHVGPRTWPCRTQLQMINDAFPDLPLFLDIETGLQLPGARPSS